MPHDLHLDPERLSAHAAVAAALSEELRAAWRGAPPGFAGETENRVHATVLRAVGDLAELSAALAAAAATAESADRGVARSIDGLQP